MKTISVSLVALVLLFVSGCAERERVFRTDPTDAPSYTSRGWQSFSNGDLESARADFASALADDPAYADAHLGRGWALLGLANSATDMATAVTSFDSAVSNGLDNADLRAGRSAAQLGADNLPQAIADATSARASAPNFVFSHRNSFTLTDLFLVESFAAAAQGNLAAALASANNITASGVDAQNPSSWIVEGTTYASFEGAALAFLHKMSEEHAG